MNKRIEFIFHIFSLIKKSEYRRAWNIVYLLILKKYFKMWHSVFKEYPTPVNTETIKKDPIIVYQMGKVGSSSVLFSLEAAYLKHKLPNVSIHHVHFLQNLEMQEEIFKQRYPQKMHILEGYKKIKNQFDNDLQQHWNIITLVRDPIARSVGAFFQRIKLYIPNWKERWENKNLPIEEIVDVFMNTEEIHLSHIWFDSELKSLIDIDVYDTSFPAELGYQLYSKPPRVDVLLIRLEDLNRIGNRVIGDFLGIPDFSLYKSNISEEKVYAEIYNAFKAVALPLEYINKMYKTKYALHFYTDKELAEFTEKWSKRNFTLYNGR